MCGSNGLGTKSWEKTAASSVLKLLLHFLLLISSLTSLTSYFFEAELIKRFSLPLSQLIWSSIMITHWGFVTRRHKMTRWVILIIRITQWASRRTVSRNFPTLSHCSAFICSLLLASIIVEPSYVHYCVAYSHQKYVSLMHYGPELSNCFSSWIRKDDHYNGTHFFLPPKQSLLKIT